jgi:hypothetical protein
VASKGMDLGIYEPTTSNSKKSATLLSNTGPDQLARMMQYELISFDGTQHTNFDSIVKKYPHLSKEIIVGLIKAGANADTPGIDKVATIDGISQVMRQATYTKSLPSMFQKDKNLFEKTRDALYGGFKGTTRVGFAALRSPYDYLTTVSRDLYALTQGEDISAGQIIKDMNPLSAITGETSTFGSLVRDTFGGKPGVDTGSGFFVSPESRVGKKQAKAMQQYGRVNNKSFTIGRGSLATIGVDPNSTAYKLASGVIDAVFNVALDPTVYLGPGALIKTGVAGKALLKAGVSEERVAKIAEAGIVGAAKQGRRLAESRAIAQSEQEFAAAAAASKDILLSGDEKKLLEAYKNEKGEITRSVNNTFKRAEEEYILANQYLTEAEVLASSSKADSIIAAVDTKLVSGVKALEEQNVVKYVEDVIIGQRQDEFIDTLSQLSADKENIGKAFPGAFLVDEMPEFGKIVPAAHGTDEFLVSLAKEKDLNVLDLAKDYSTLNVQEASLELTLRARLADEVETLIQTNVFPKKTTAALKIIQGSGFFDDLAFGEGIQNLGQLIGKVAETKNNHAVEILTGFIEDLYKVDAFSNIRSIYGGTGGIAIVTKGAIAARGIKMSSTLADSKNITSVVDVPKSLIQAQDNVINAEAARDAALAAKVNIEKNLKEIKALKDYATKDPDLIANIVNNPEYAPLQKLMDLELRMANKAAEKEFLRAEAGLVDGIGGPLAPDLTKVNKFLLGKRFAVIANIVAQETSASKIARLFNNKMDLEVAGQLADAKTGDEVLAVLRTHLADPVSDPQLARSMTLKGQTAAVATPIIKSVIAPNGKAIRAIEKLDRAMSRVYIRSTILPLDDMDKLGQGLREWMQSAEVPLDVIDDTIDKLIKAKASTGRNMNALRAKIIDDAFQQTHKAIVDKYSPGNKELLEILQKELKIAGDDRALITNYANSLRANNKLPFIAMVDGKEVAATGAVYAHQFLDDVVRLPDNATIVRAVKDFKRRGPLLSTRANLDAFQVQVGEHWRTAQLAFRISYIIRNMGEMQVRQYLSGHDTLLNHPMGYLAMMYGNPKGNSMQKFFSRIEKYKNDIMDNDFKDPTAATLFTEAMDEYLEFMGRQISHADPRSADAKVRVLGKIYQVVESAHPKFSEAFATTLSRFSVDDMMQLVAKADSPDKQAKLVDDLVSNKTIRINDMDRTEVLREIYEASRISRGNRKVSDFDEIFLLDATKGFAPDNINVTGVRNWLFDENSTASYATALNGLMGSGPKGIYIRKLMADGVVEVPLSDGTNYILRMPKYRNSIDFEEGGKRAVSFREEISRLFPSEDMPNASAIWSDTKAWLQENNNVLKRGVDAFFQMAAKAENLVNFGPEYRMSYWDHIGRYAPALSLSDLQKLQKSAAKTLAPIRLSKGGKFIPVGRQNQTLRIIESEIKARKKNPDFKAAMSYGDAHVAASTVAGKATKSLFYDASRTLDSTNKMRLIFPFLQAHVNTLKTWGTLTAKNPIQVYKFAKAFDALTKPGSAAIYDITNTQYEESQGFFYKDEFGVNRFRYPLLGNLMGAFAGKNLDAAQAVQLTAPVEALNLAMGAVNPMMPGVGPVMQAAFKASGQSKSFGPAYDFMRQWIFPFGEKGVYDIVIPAWLNKTIMLGMNDQLAVEKGVKSWAGFLASTGEFGDNPFGDDTQRNALFEKAEGMSRWVAGFTAIFQSILPATPSQEVLSKIKTDEGKYQFIAQSMLYKAWKDINEENAGDYEESVADFSEKYGLENLAVILSGSTKSVTGTQDAWSFLNKNASVVGNYASKEADIVPYFFPGGEAAMAYYNWQVASGRREKLSTADLSNAAENMLYNLEKSQITEQQIREGHSDIWYTQEIIDLNKRYGGEPIESVSPGRAKARAEVVGLALNEPAFKQSPIYAEAAQFYSEYDRRIKVLQRDRVSVSPDLSSGFWLNTQYRNELITLGTELMLKNPEFSHMYYSVFAPLLKVESK